MKNTNTKTITIKCIQFNLNENFKMIGDPIYREFAGSTLKEAKAEWKAARDNNDVVKFSPLTIYDITSTEEEE